MKIFIEKQIPIHSSVVPPIFYYIFSDKNRGLTYSSDSYSSLWTASLIEEKIKTKFPSFQMDTLNNKPMRGFLLLDEDRAFYEMCVNRITNLVEIEI